MNISLAIQAFVNHSINMKFWVRCYQLLQKVWVIITIKFSFGNQRWVCANNGGSVNNKVKIAGYDISNKDDKSYDKNYNNKQEEKIKK